MATPSFRRDQRPNNRTGRPSNSRRRQPSCSLSASIRYLGSRHAPGSTIPRLEHTTDTQGHVLATPPREESPPVVWTGKSLHQGLKRRPTKEPCRRHAVVGMTYIPWRLAARVLGAMCVSFPRELVNMEFPT